MHPTATYEGSTYTAKDQSTVPAACRQETKIDVNDLGERDDRPYHNQHAIGRYVHSSRHAVSGDAHIHQVGVDKDGQLERVRSSLFGPLQ